MSERPFYRLSAKSAQWTEQAVAAAEHLITKHADGTFTCERHHCPAERCLPRTTDLVWHNTVDRGAYTVSVIRSAPYRGELRVVHGSRTLLTTSVPLTYDAAFGPDIEDVAAWQSMAITVIDADYRARGAQPPA